MKRPGCCFRSSGFNLAQPISQLTSRHSTSSTSSMASSAMDSKALLGMLLTCALVLGSFALTAQLPMWGLSNAAPSAHAADSSTPSLLTPVAEETARQVRIREAGGRGSSPGYNGSSVVHAAAADNVALDAAHEIKLSPDEDRPDHLRLGNIDKLPVGQDTIGFIDLINTLDATDVPATSQSDSLHLQESPLPANADSVVRRHLLDAEVRKSGACIPSVYLCIWGMLEYVENNKGKRIVCHSCILLLPAAH